MTEKTKGFQDLLDMLNKTDPFGKDGILCDCEKGIEDLEYDPFRRIVQRFVGALFTDQIIILSGPPGTGKTSLPFAVADKLKESGFDVECELIPVQPNWTDNQDLMGYYNPKDHYYVSTPFMDALQRADKEKDKIFFVILDEMNLAHIEYYFSTMLSVMERNAGKNENPEPLYLYSQREWERIPESERKENPNLIEPTFILPKNVQIIGTLNMDETTKGISPKVIDRSYVLEIVKDRFSMGDNPHLEEERWSFQDVEDDVGRILEIDISYRLKRQFESMMARKRFLNLDDFYVGKVLPMLNGNEYKTKWGILSDFPEEDYPLTNEKLSRMRVERGKEDDCFLEQFFFWK